MTGSLVDGAICTIREAISGANTKFGSTRRIRRYSELVNEEENESKSMLSETQSHYDEDDRNNQAVGTLIEEEEAMIGKVRWAVYFDYFRKIGVFTSLITLSLYVLCNALTVCSTFALSKWADVNEKNLSIAANNTKIYLPLFGGFGFAQICLEFIRELVFFLSCVNASKLIHESLLKGMTFLLTIL